MSREFHRRCSGGLNRRWEIETTRLGIAAERLDESTIRRVVYLGSKNSIVEFSKEENQYPFTPPDVRIVNGDTVYEYKTLLKTLHESPGIAACLVREVFGDRCIVCDSILCRGHWSGPQTSLTHVLEEVLLGLWLKLRYSDRLLLRKVSQNVPALGPDVCGIIESFL